ncbi:MAG: ketoacyl-ACP synthase III [Porticoccaceae bacterium]|nr:ketoacyl-ACP synthase III [Porticoccaceae bacterium]MDG1311845.1 ketoacyl-ACP synthase III [Porticoccaceae bacterium]
MNYAEITGWGKYVPKLLMTNDDMAKIIDTSDEWIFSRSGIRQRHYSHVSTGEMGWLAAERALAAAGVDASDIDLVVLGSTTPEEICPNTASFIKNKLGATKAAAFDLNSACTSWLYGMNVATDMIKAGSIKKALVIGSERISLAMDWSKRESCFLFGDGAGAVVIEATKEKLGLLSAHMSCVPDSRECLHLPSWGMSPSHLTGDIHVSLNFEGQEIFKSAVKGMADSIANVLEREGLTAEDIDLFVPHQANVRIIQTLAKRLNFPIEKVMVCIDEYANTSAAAIPLALCDALTDKRVKPGMTILTASFGAGLTCGAGVIRWSDRVEPLQTSDADIVPYDGTVFDLMEDSFTYYGVDAQHLLTK